MPPNRALPLSITTAATKRNDAEIGTSRRPANLAYPGLLATHSSVDRGRSSVCVELLSCGQSAILRPDLDLQHRPRVRPSAHERERSLSIFRQVASFNFGEGLCGLIPASPSKTRYH